MEKPPDNVIIFFNKLAGGGGKEEKIASISQSLQSKGHHVEVIELTTRGSLRLKSVIECGKKWLILAGGDGTLHQCLNQLYSHSDEKQILPLFSVFPIGSGNDWASERAYPTQPKRWIDSVYFGVKKEMHCGLATLFQNGEKKKVLIWNSAGMGITGNVVEELAKLRDCDRIKANYLRLALKHFFSYAYPVFYLRVDGKEATHRPLTINIGTGRQTGGGMKFFPQSNSSGELKCTIINKPSLLAIPRLIYSLYYGDISKLAKTVNCFNFKEFTAKSNCSRFFIEIDGEGYQTESVKIGMFQKKFSFLLPDK
ncbi:MAG: hypothetical protein EA409_10945 [Saprospirales bacterium]|nr:MAG: hypothetical protein EA409_10945 [Saprospirales bacterium]